QFRLRPLARFAARFVFGLAIRFGRARPLRWGRLAGHLLLRSERRRLESSPDRLGLLRLDRAALRVRLLKLLPPLPEFVHLVRSIPELVAMPLVHPSETERSLLFSAREPVKRHRERLGIALPP